VLYTPQLARPFGPLKNTDLNTNLAAIRDAFNSLSAQVQTSAGGAFSNSSGGALNILVDLTSAGAVGTYVTQQLPQNPAIGDPWVTVEVQQTGISGANVASCIVTTGDGTLIMGVATTGSFDGLPFLTNPGDRLTFAYIGGSYGWVIIDGNVSSYVTPTSATAVQTWDPTKLHVFSGLDSVVDTRLITNTTLSLAGINKPGLQASMMIGPSAGAPVNIVTSSGSQVFNGVTGVYTLSVQYRRYRFTCISADHFTVTVSA
jgi:hypothetical protein